MKEIISEEAIRDKPKIKVEEEKVCPECENKNQIIMSHPMLQHQTTSKVLELLHMNVMRPLR